VINGVVEVFSPLPHYLRVSAKTSSHLLIQEDDPRSVAELEALAVENLQNIIYQADEKLIKAWLPFISSALKA
jgi:hypothetical protein